MDEFPDLSWHLVEYETINGVEMRHSHDVRLLNEVLKRRPPRPLKALVLPEKKPRIELVTTKRKVS